MYYMRPEKKKQEGLAKVSFETKTKQKQVSGKEAPPLLICMTTRNSKKCWWMVGKDGGRGRGSVLWSWARSIYLTSTQSIKIIDQWRVNLHDKPHGPHVKRLYGNLTTRPLWFMRWPYDDLKALSRHLS
jgi:hypothetical protein